MRLLLLLLLGSSLLMTVCCQDNSNPGPACLGAGWYNGGTAAASPICLQCPLGHKCPEGQAAPVPCPAGTYQDMLNRASCRDCDLGFFQNATAQTACNACPTGWTTSAVGMSFCDICIPNNFYRNGTRCLSRGPPYKCEPATQYEDPASANSTRVCKPLTQCDVSLKSVPEPVSINALSTAVKITPRNQYILRYPTATSDRVCSKKWSEMRCAADRYALQLPVDDENGFLIKPLICRPYTTCITGLQYMKVNGRITGDRDNVCVRYTQCNATTEYLIQQGNATHDNICKPYTQCIAGLEYLLKKGDAANDNVCAQKTFCAAQSNRAMYEKTPPVDSTAWSVLGKDAVCAPVSTCPAGKYVSVAATDTSDVTCDFCPKGMYKSSSMQKCEVCPQGFYSNVLGSTSCKPCTDCLAPSQNNATCMFPNASLCRNTFAKNCQKDADAVCSKCPVEEKGWAVDAVSGICQGCRDGYYSDMTISDQWERCVPCTANFYCSATDEFQECQASSLHRVYAIMSSSRRDAHPCIKNF